MRWWKARLVGVEEYATRKPAGDWAGGSCTLQGEAIKAKMIGSQINGSAYVPDS
jgi:hypothetical protein